jgi:hypothetical protein
MGGKPEQALRHYQQYLAEAPDGEQAGTVRGLVTELTAKLSRPAQATPDGDGSGAQGTLRSAGLATSGAGIAALAVGTGFALHARSLSNQLQPGGTWDPDKDAAGRRANKIAIAGFVAGGALIATGAVLYWRGRVRDRTSEKPIVAPAISDRSIGLVVIGQWP